MRILALDLGTKRCGVAISDKTNIIACPHSLLSYYNEDYKNLADQLQVILEDNCITDLVIGKPINMDGSSGFATKRGEILLEFLNTENINVHFIDERLTTVMASNILRESGKDTRKSKKIIDTLSACIILETYMKRLYR